MSNGDWVSFSLRRGLVEHCDRVPTSIRRWKEEFFFVDTSAISGLMTYGVTADRGSDALTDVSTKERETIDHFGS